MMDKKDYEPVRFGDVVRSIRETEHNPLERGLEICVGIDNIEPENLHIKDWGLVKEGTSFNRVFRKGQVLFVRRRAYQRKVALAEFDGICSGDIIVMEAIADKLIPELLPFVVQSENFYRYAIKTSAGSLSPRTKWKHLAEYQFHLPPIEEQRRIAEILWALDEIFEKKLCLHAKTIKLRYAYFRENFWNNLLEVSKSKDTFQPISKCVDEKHEKSEYPHSKSRYLGLENLISGSWKVQGYEDSKKFKSNCNIFEKGDLLYGKLRPNLDKAIIAPFDGVCSTEILVLTAKKITTNKFLLHHFHSPRFINYNSHIAYGTKMPRTSFEIISDYRIPIPNEETQKFLISDMDQILLIENEINNYLEKLADLKMSLLDYFLG